MKAYHFRRMFDKVVGSVFYLNEIYEIDDNGVKYRLSKNRLGYLTLYLPDKIMMDGKAYGAWKVLKETKEGEMLKDSKYESYPVLDEKESLRVLRMYESNKSSLVKVTFR